MANDAKNDTTVEEWVDSVAEVITSTVAQRGFFSLSNFTPAVETGDGRHLHQRPTRISTNSPRAFISSCTRANSTPPPPSSTRVVGRGFCVKSPTVAKRVKSRTASQIRVALVDADADTIETVDVSPLPEDAISTTRPFLRSAKSVPKTPPGVTPPRIPHITRNQLDHKAAKRWAFANPASSSSSTVPPDVPFASVSTAS